MTSLIQQYFAGLIIAGHVLLFEVLNCLANIFKTQITAPISYAEQQILAFKLTHEYQFSNYLQFTGKQLYRKLTCFFYIIVKNVKHLIFPCLPMVSSSSTQKSYFACRISLISHFSQGFSTLRWHVIIQYSTEFLHRAYGNITDGPVRRNTSF